MTTIDSFPIPQQTTTTTATTKLSIQTTNLTTKNKNIITTTTENNNIKSFSSINCNDNIRLIEYTEFEDIIVLNTECYGLIKKAYWKKEEKYVYLKFINDLELGYQLEKIIDKSNQIVQQSGHENIIQLFGVTQDQNNCFLVLQYTNNGNLREYLTKNRESLKWIDKLRLAKDIVAGLKFLHDNEIFHGELYPQHVFINDSRALLHNPNLFSFDYYDTASSTTPSFKNSVPGIIPYIDPQMLGKKLNICTHSLQQLRECKQRSEKDDDGNDGDDVDDEYLKSDIYSLGVILWEISSIREPFNDAKNQVVLRVSIMIRNKRELPAEGIPDYFIELYQDCWDNETENRPCINYVYDKLSEFLDDELNVKSDDEKEKEKEKENENENENEVEVEKNENENEDEDEVNENPIITENVDDSMIIPSSLSPSQPIIVSKSEISENNVPASLSTSEPQESQKSTQRKISISENLHQSDLNIDDTELESQTCPKQRKRSSLSILVKSIFRRKSNSSSKSSGSNKNENENDENENNDENKINKNSNKKSENNNENDENKNESNNNNNKNESENENNLENDENKNESKNRDENENENKINKVKNKNKDKKKDGKKDKNRNENENQIDKNKKNKDKNEKNKSKNKNKKSTCTPAPSSSSSSDAAPAVKRKHSSLSSKKKLLFFQKNREK